MLSQGVVRVQVVKSSRSKDHHSFSRGVPVIKCPSPPQGGVPCAPSVPISLRSYLVRKSLVHEGKGQSWPGGQSFRIRVRQWVTMGQGPQGSQSVTVGSSQGGVCIAQRSQSVPGHQGDHSLEAPPTVVQNPLPSPLAHLMASAVLYTLFLAH